MSDRPEIAVRFKPSEPGLRKFFGKLEAELMEIVWDNPPLTIKRALHFINKNQDYAYTTVMTVMNRLVEKNILKREKKGHSFTYTAVLSKNEFIDQSAEQIITGLVKDYPDLVDRIFGKTKKAAKKKR